MNEYTIISPYGVSIKIEGTHINCGHIWIDGEWVAKVPDEWLVIKKVL